MTTVSGRRPNRPARKDSDLRVLRPRILPGGDFHLSDGAEKYVPPGDKDLVEGETFHPTRASEPRLVEEKTASEESKNFETFETPGLLCCR